MLRLLLRSTGAHLANAALLPQHTASVVGCVVEHSPEVSLTTFNTPGCSTAAYDQNVGSACTAEDLSGR